MCYYMSTPWCTDEQAKQHTEIVHNTTKEINITAVAVIQLFKTYL